MRVETIGDATLYLGDCRECEFPADAAIVSDPPYGMRFDTDSTRFSGGKRGRGEGRSDRLITGDDQDFDPMPWLRFRECILWGANHYAQRLPVGSTLVWLKRYCDAYGSFLSDAEIGWQKGGHGVYCLHAPDSAGRRQKEFTGSPFGGETAHPTQKPAALMEWCIDRVAAHTVVDPYMGSGTTGVACAKLGRRFIGCEIEPKYFDIACRRIADAMKQGDLFIDGPKEHPKETQLPLLREGV